MYSLTQRRLHFLFSLWLPIAIGTSFSCTAHAERASPQAGDAYDVATREAFQDAVDAQRVAITEENAKTAPRMAWAGDYYGGDGLGENVSMSLAPHAGVAATWKGCLGTYAANKGSVLPQADGSLRLKYEESNDPKGIGFADHVVPVPWGERMYLIPEEELSAFASAVNLGDEPRKDAQGMFLMRQGDEKRKVGGMPLLPLAQRSLIRRVPLEVGVDAAKLVRDDHADRCHYRLELDHGANDGLATGMKLRPIGAPAYGRVTLEQVTPTRAVGAISLFGDECTKPDQRLLTKARFTSGAYRGLSAGDKP